MKTAAEPTPEMMASRPIGYFGHRKSGRAQVFRRPRAGSETGPMLDPHLDVRSHSPGGIGWGYMGSGSTQLSLAILVDYLGDVAQAEDLYQDFKSAVVANLPEAEWTLSNQEIAEALEVIHAEHALRSDNLSCEGK